MNIERKLSCTVSAAVGITGAVFAARNTGAPVGALGAPRLDGAPFCWAGNGASGMERFTRSAVDVVGTGGSEHAPDDEGGGAGLSTDLPCDLVGDGCDRAVPLAWGAAESALQSAAKRAPLMDSEMSARSSAARFDLAMVVERARTAALVAARPTSLTCWIDCASSQSSVSRALARTH